MAGKILEELVIFEHMRANIRVIIHRKTDQNTYLRMD